MKFLFCILVLFCGVSWATTYYISSSGGNDSNNGTSSGTPWQNIDMINFHSFSPGDQILLKAGDTWDSFISVTTAVEGDGSSGSPIVIGKYGTGANPIIYGDMHTASWSSVAGHSGIYQANAGRGTVILNNAVEGTTALTYVDPGALNLQNPTDLNTYLSSFVAGDWGPAVMFGGGVTPNIVYVATLDGLTPTTVSVFRYDVITLGSNYATAQDVSVQQSYNGFDVAGSNDIVQRVAVANMLDFGVSFATTSSNCTIQDSTINLTGNDAIFMAGTSNTVQRNTVTNVQSPILGLVETGGDSAGIGVTGTGNIARYNSFSNVRTSCFDYYQAYNTVLSYNYCAQFHDIGGATDGTGNLFSYNVLNLGGATANSGFTASDSGGGNPTLIYNNTFYGMQNTGSYSVFVGGAGQVNLANNIWYSTGAGMVSWSNTDASSTSDYNQYYIAGTSTFSNGANNYTTLAAYVSATGRDTHSAFGDPKFNNASGGDFTLQASSPVINAGANLGSTYQLALVPGSSWPENVQTGNQNSYGAGWEMGAFLYGASLTSGSIISGNAKLNGNMSVQ